MLIVIDIQDGFRTDTTPFETQYWDETLQRIVGRIKQARRYGERVVVVEAEDGGKLCYNLRKAIKSYNKVSFVTKYDMDGSLDIDRALRANQKHRYRGPVELCGAYRDQCVVATWMGLKDIGYNVQPVRVDLTVGEFPLTYKFPDGYLVEE